MSSFLFYDPNNKHPAASQLDIYINRIQNIQALRDAINNSNNLQQVVCICSGDKSAIIEEIKDRQHIVSIYPCKDRDHGEPEKNPVFSPKVKDDLPLTSDSGWEFKGRLALLEACIMRKDNAHVQALNELQRLKRIEQQSSFIPQPGTEAT